MNTQNLREWMANGWKSELATKEKGLVDENLEEEARVEAKEENLSQED